MQFRVKLGSSNEESHVEKTLINIIYWHVQVMETLNHIKHNIAHKGYIPSGHQFLTRCNVIMREQSE